MINLNNNDGYYIGLDSIIKNISGIFDSGNVYNILALKFYFKDDDGKDTVFYGTVRIDNYDRESLGDIDKLDNSIIDDIVKDSYREVFDKYGDKVNYKVLSIKDYIVDTLSSLKTKYNYMDANKYDLIKKLLDDFKYIQSLRCSCEFCLFNKHENFDKINDIDLICKNCVSSGLTNWTYENQMELLNFGGR